MLLLIHIGIALASIVYATSIFIKPADSKFKLAYILTGSTLVSGTILVVERSSHLVESCVSGLIYTFSVLILIVLSKRKLALSSQKYR